MILGCYVWNLSTLKTSHFSGQSFQHLRAEAWLHAASPSFKRLSNPSPTLRPWVNYQKISCGTSCWLGENPHRLSSSSWRYNPGLRHMWVRTKAAGLPLFSPLPWIEGLKLNWFSTPYDNSNFGECLSSTRNFYLLFQWLGPYWDYPLWASRLCMGTSLISTSSACPAPFSISHTTASFHAYLFPNRHALISTFIASIFLVSKP